MIAWVNVQLDIKLTKKQENVNMKNNVLNHSSNAMVFATN